MGVHARFELANRRQIEDEIERLIALLDASDSPLDDLEPETDLCLAGDDGCGAVLRQGLTLWGSEAEAGGLLTESPDYGVDQTAGPRNYRVASRTYYERQIAR